MYFNLIYAKELAKKLEYARREIICKNMDKDEFFFVRTIGFR